MDRLRKRLEDCRLKVRKFVKYNWHNEPEGDKFRSLNVLFILGAVRYKPVQKWQRIFWNAYCIVPTFSFLYMALRAVDELPGRFDLMKITWHAALVLAASFCFVKDLILHQHFESIQTAQRFVNSKPFASGDLVTQKSNDSAYREKCFQRLQLAASALLSMIMIDEIVMNVPIFKIKDFFGSPRILQYLGPTFAMGGRFIFFSTYSPLWISKYCAGTFTICFLLYGIKTEYDIFVRSFDNILDNVYWDVEEELSSTVKGAPDWKRFQRDQLYWKHLEQRVIDHVKVHVQLVKNISLLAPVVKNLFGIIYYTAMVAFAPVIYILATISLSPLSFFLVSGISIQLLECYVWCRMIDSLKDTNEKLELTIMNLATKIPYSQYHRRKYAEMRTTLCILKIFVRNHEPFSCFGVFPISVEAFTELLHIGYTVFTFLRDMAKKDLTTSRRLKQRKHK